QNPYRSPAPRIDRVERPEDRLGLHHHPGPTAVRHIVDAAMPVGGEITQVVNRHLEQPPVDCPSHNTSCQSCFDHRRKNGGDVESHAFRSNSPSGGSITIRLPGTSIVRQISVASGIRISPLAPATTNRLPATLPSTSFTSPTSSPCAVTTRHPTRSW